jgi:hypothetical protein
VGAVLAGLLVAGTSLGSTCTDSLPGALGPGGTLTVHVLGLAASPVPADGGSVSVTTTNVAGNVAFPGTLPASGIASGDVPPGDYTISYTPPSGYLLATGESATKTASVTSGQPIEVSFNVVVASSPTGTLTLTVTGLTGSALSGGSASILRTDIGGQTPQTQAIASNGTINLAVAAGTYTVTYTAPTGYALNGGVTNPQTGVVVPADGSKTVTFAVTATAGTLAITVTGLTGSPANGGSAVAQRTDSAGTPITINVSAAGSGRNAGVPAGTYTVTYTPPSGFSVTGTNPRTGVAVSRGATATATFAVQALGTLQVTVTGLTGSPANGGSAVAQRTDAAGTPITINVSAAGSGSNTSVPAGTYTVTYTPPSGFTVSGTNPRTGLVVSRGATATAAFTVQGSTAVGTLQVTVTGLTGSPANGGSAVAQRTDAAGTAITINVSAAGSGSNPSVPAGTYSVTYTPPAGFSVVGTDPVTGVVVTSGGTATATFTVAVASAGAPNIYGFGFEDGTGGSFRDPSGGSMFAGAWGIDSSTSFRGRFSVRQTYTVTSGNTGDAFIYSLGTARTAIYVQFAFRQSNPFNNDGVNNSDQMKVFRLHGPGVTGNLASFFISNSKNSSPGVPLVSFSDLEGGIQHAPNRSSWDANAHLGEWHVYQFYFDISTSGALVERGWIDGTLMWDYTISASSGGKTFGVVSFSDVINSMASQSTAWYDDIGISSQPIAAP